MGRERELILLRGMFDRVQRGCEPQLLTLVGVPGIGKTRLVSELARELDRRGDWRSLEGRSLPYGEGATFWAFCEIVRAFTGVLDSDGDEGATRKVHGAVEAVVADPSEAAWLERHLRPLVGVDTDELGSGDRRGEAFAAWRRLLEALAEERPLVLVFDDLHWADDGLLDFVDHVVDWASGVPILVLATARPDLLDRRPAWGGGRANATAIRLSPLSPEETTTLLRALFAESAAPRGVHADLLERAGGNPFYAEEFARMVLAVRRCRRPDPGGVRTRPARLDGQSADGVRPPDVPGATRARAAGEMVDVVERAVEEHPTYPVWSYVLLDVDTELGREDRARATVARLAAEGFPLYLEMQWLFGMSLLPEVCRYLDDPEGASTVYARLRPFGHLNATLPPELCRGSVSRGLGILAATMGRWSEAVEHFEAALRMNAGMGARPWLAHAQYDYARALRRRGDPGDRVQATELLTSAATSARALGMRSLADKVSSLD